MDSNDPVINLLMAKYARRELLTPEELQLLEAWWGASPENRELADLVRDEKWVKEALEIMDEASEQEMWKEFSRRLDEKQGIIRPSPVRGFRMQRRILLRGLAAAVVLFLAVRAGWLLTRSWRPGTAPGEIVSAPRSREPATGDQPVLSTAVTGEERSFPVENRVLRREGTRTPTGAGVHIRPEAHIHSSDRNAGDARANHGPVPVKQRVNRHDPTLVPVDTGNLVHYCRAVVPSPSTDISPTEHTVAYPYSYSAKALLAILGDLEGPTEIHLPNGKRMRVAGTRRFENAGIDPRKGAAPADPSAAFHFKDADLERVLAQVAEWYGLKVSNPGGWKGGAITGELPRSSRPDSVLYTLQLLEKGFVQLRLDQKVIVVSGWPGASGGR